MVSFGGLFIAFTAVLGLCEGAHIGRRHKHHTKSHTSHFYNTTSVVPSGTGVQTETPILTFSPTTTLEGAVTSCVTRYETKTFTYTLGNGHTVTTTITQTNIITSTLEPPASTTIEPLGESSPAPGESSSTSTTTETSTTTTSTTVTFTVTHTLPPDGTAEVTQTLPEVTPPVEVSTTYLVGTDPVTTPCIAETTTVYVTVPESVSVTTIEHTVYETVKDTVTETVTVSDTHTSLPIPPASTTLPPIPTSSPILPPYSNSTTTTTTNHVVKTTLTVVPLPSGF